MRRPNGKNRVREEEETRRAQLLWTFVVALAFALAALFSAVSPKSALMDGGQELGGNGPQGRLLDRAPAAP